MLNQTATPTIISKHTYTLDAVGNRTQLAEVLAQVGGGSISPTNTYGYDGLYRLTSSAQTGIPQTTLFGDQTVEANLDTAPVGQAEAFQYTATTNGTANQLSIYLDATNTANQVMVGLYANAAGNVPGSLLAQATISSPTAGAWNTVAISPVNVSAGTIYWIAVLQPASTTGTVQWRDVAVGANASASVEATLTSLPATWTPGSTWPNSPMSAYAVQLGDAPASYGYDPVGNRLSWNGTSYTYDRADRIQTAGSTNYTVNVVGAARTASSTTRRTG